MVPRSTGHLGLPGSPSEPSLPGGSPHCASLYVCSPCSPSPTQWVARKQSRDSEEPGSRARCLCQIPALPPWASHLKPLSPWEKQCSIRASLDSRPFLFCMKSLTLFLSEDTASTNSCLSPTASISPQTDYSHPYATMLSAHRKEETSRLHFLHQHLLSHLPHFCSSLLQKSKKNSLYSPPCCLECTPPRLPLLLSPRARRPLCCWTRWLVLRGTGHN